jgi:hypothetical protein
VGQGSAVEACEYGGGSSFHANPLAQQWREWGRDTAAVDAVGANGH